MIQVTQSVHQMPAIVLKYPEFVVRKCIHQVLFAVHMKDPDYLLRTRVGAFLQSDSSNLVMVEFWTGKPEDHQAFADRINQLVAEKVSAPSS